MQRILDGFIQTKTRGSLGQVFRGPCVRHKDGHVVVTKVGRIPVEDHRSLVGTFGHDALLVFLFAWPKSGYMEKRTRCC